VDTVFERFPASVRGAVVVRGRDRDPHQVRLVDASVLEVRASTQPVRSLELGEVVLDVAPRREVMIPFEVPFANLDPGWYEVVAEVEVDGQVRVEGPGEPRRRFVVSWPEGTIRRGRIEADLRIRVPGSRSGATIERVDLRLDSAVIRWRHAPGEGPESQEFGDLRVHADRERLPTLSDEYEWSTGRRVTTVYPVPVRRRHLVFQLDRRVRRGKPVQRGSWSATLDLP
jgi:hypothetical protein